MLNVEFTYSAGLSSQLRPDDRPDVVFSGRSNVGKSSLINKLCNRKALARVSSRPGKTATINFFDAGTFNLVDLPGYGYAKVSKAEKMRWAELVEGYFAAGRNIALVVQIVDMRHKPTADDMNMINFLYDSGVPFIVVMTKSDKLNKSEYSAQMEQMAKIMAAYPNVGLYPFSALSGDGAEAITDAIEQYLR
ncbi:MAG: YihA family ribosome biogenesis GTP-binding protein [Ruminococcus sp.]|uniref:ribosome biogenesis GTP-binding protein YihA/YsxC n=1 Tax=Ruminococcus sp. TaxID=41978 RepID=UPI0028734F7F|nr:ribosome biogenesis GTP-binding protein YihA/YsxC [Ruminococcus sp.]MBQ3284995.1 YihA family ribosome biogenesis GTP-binding protein [Ruminococcus sp.]